MKEGAVRNLLTTLLEVAGLGLITAGAASASTPLGLTVGGGSLLLVGFLEGRK